MSNRSSAENFNFAPFEKESRLSRRTLLKAIGLIGLAGAGDVYLTNEAQRRKRVGLTEFVTELDTYQPDKAWVVLPGYGMGWDNSKEIAQSLAPSLREFGRVAWLGHNNQGLDVDEVTDTIDRYARQAKLRGLFLDGHSFGGMLAAEVGDRLADKPAYDIELIALDSSPSSKFDVYEQLEVMLLSLSFAAKIPVPTSVRGIYEFYERLVNKNERSYKQIAEQALSTLSPDAPSSRLLQSEGDYINKFDLDNFKLPDSAELGLVANIQDDVVKTSRAQASWSNWAAKSDKQLKTVWLHGSQPPHASSVWNQEMYQDAFTELQQSLLKLPPESIIKYY